MELIDVDIDLDTHTRRASEVSGSIGNRQLALTVQRSTRLRNARFDGTFDTSNVSGQVKRAGLDGAHGPDRIALTLERDGNVATVVGRIGRDRIKLEFVSRTSGPSIVRLLSNPRHVPGAGLELSATLLSGSVERVSDALAASLIAPMVLHTERDPGGPTMWI